MNQPMAGLCAACGLSPGCVHARTGTRPIVQCEQFQLDLPAAGIQDEPPAASSLVRRQAPRHAGAGLCALCASFSHWTYPRPGRGGWLCEELL
jgi:hypothetical protein